MAVNELNLTVIGWVGNEPTHYPGTQGQVPFTSFRLASTARVYDRVQDAFVDSGTSWFTVKSFRDLARNVGESVRRGDPVVVHGRLTMAEWVSPDGQVRVTAELVADSVGHDLARGTTRFTRVLHDARAGRGGDGGPDGRGSAAGGDGGPVDVSGAVVLEDEPDEVLPEAVAIGA